MEPVSTLIVAAAFLVPAASTRRLIWDSNTEVKPQVSQEEKRYTSVSLLPGTVLPITNYILYKPDVAPTLGFREQLKRETKSYSAFKPGWDGLGSSPPSAIAMDRALRLIDSLPAQLPLPRPMLSFNGELGLYWDLQGGYAELTFEVDGQISFFSRDLNGSEYFDENFESDVFDRSWILGEIRRFDMPFQAAA